MTSGPLMAIKKGSLFGAETTFFFLIFNECNAKNPNGIKLVMSLSLMRSLLRIELTNLSSFPPIPDFLICTTSERLI